MFQFETTISPQEVARILKAFFNESELRDLCFELKVDYENIPGANKSDKARELVVHMERHGRFLQLCDQVINLRPHAINIPSLGELAIRSFENNDPRLGDVQKLLVQIREYCEQLSEWKELHNHLDETLTVFEQFSSQVEWRATRNDVINPILLDRSWQPINRRVEHFLIWSKRIKYIGKPYQELANGEKQGARWAVEVGIRRQAIIVALQGYPPTLKLMSDENKWRRMISFLPVVSEQKYRWQQWWSDLWDVTSEFDNTLKNHMFMADKELRKTAADLLDLSKLI